MLFVGRRKTAPRLKVHIHGAVAFTFDYFSHKVNSYELATEFGEAVIVCNHGLVEVSSTSTKKLEVSLSHHLKYPN